ncbi:MAG TPA: hypothetical protein VJB65_00905 [Patescibacteria group bacterium]|nr:hypothetical protein [Patescibacteria group bacterium]
MGLFKREKELRIGGGHEQNVRPIEQPDIQKSQQELQRSQEQHTQSQESKGSEIQQPGVTGTQTAQQQTGTAQTIQPKTAERIEIEKVLSEGLAGLYQSMTPEEQEQFRLKGEEAAGAIELLMHTFKATARKVLSLIREWLATIPRVNKFFLEQESKLKTDKFMQLQKKMRKEERIKKIRRDS